MCKHFLGCNAGVGVCTCLHEYISQCQTGNANVKHFVNLRVRIGTSVRFSSISTWLLLRFHKVEYKPLYDHSRRFQYEVSVDSHSWCFMSLYALCIVTRSCSPSLAFYLWTLFEAEWTWAVLRRIPASCISFLRSIHLWLPGIKCAKLFFQIISIVILLQLSHFFPLCPSPLNPPPSPTVSSHPVVHVHGSFTHVLCLLLQPFIQWQSRIKLKFLSMV